MTSREGNPVLGGLASTGREAAGRDSEAADERGLEPAVQCVGQRRVGEEDAVVAGDLFGELFDRFLTAETHAKLHSP